MNLLISVQSGSLSEHIFLWLCSQPLIETLRSDRERIRGLDREGSDDRKRGATNRMSEQIPLLVLFSICALWKCLLLLSLLTRCAIVVIFSIADAIYIKFNWLENQIDSIRTAATTASTMDNAHLPLTRRRLCMGIPRANRPKWKPTSIGQYTSRISDSKSFILPPFGYVSDLGFAVGLM